MNVKVIRDVAQPGSAFAWGASGRWFESSHPDQPHGGREASVVGAEFIRASFDVLFLFLNNFRRLWRFFCFKRPRSG